MSEKNNDTPLMVTILGPTATGKTSLAANIAASLDGEIISADSRQVYRGMDLGTGKDYADYIVNGQKIPYHLVDIVDPGYEYNVFEFQQDFLKVLPKIIEKGKLPILCGGTGMYLEAVLSGYKLLTVPENHELRSSLQNKSLEELNIVLHGFRDIHNTTDGTHRERAIRAIEIAAFRKMNLQDHNLMPKIDHRIFGVYFERSVIRGRITTRLKQRLDSGMLDEIKSLIGSGLTPEQLTFYGLEYRYLTDYVTGKIDYNEMFTKLNTAIHQFAKRQMTWFRRMEKKGLNIVWIDGEISLQEKMEVITRKMGEGRG